jgi:hypothetical protein
VGASCVYPHTGGGPQGGHRVHSPADRGPQGRANRPVEGAPALHLAWSNKPPGCHGLQEPPEEASGTLPAVLPSEERWGRTSAGATNPIIASSEPRGSPLRASVRPPGSRLVTPAAYRPKNVAIRSERSRPSKASSILGLPPSGFSGMRYRSLRRRYPRVYEQLMVEKNGGGWLFGFGGGEYRSERLAHFGAFCVGTPVGG